MAFSKYLNFKDPWLIFPTPKKYKIDPVFPFNIKVELSIVRSLCTKQTWFGHKVKSHCNLSQSLWYLVWGFSFYCHMMMFLHRFFQPKNHQSVKFTILWKRGEKGKIDLCWLVKHDTYLVKLIKICQNDDTWVWIINGQWSSSFTCSHIFVTFHRHFWAAYF